MLPNESALVLEDGGGTPPGSNLDPALVAKILKHCSPIFQETYVTLNDAYTHGVLSIVERDSGGGKITYDVGYRGTVVCVSAEDVL